MMDLRASFMLCLPRSPRQHEALSVPLANAVITNDDRTST